MNRLERMVERKISARQLLGTRINEKSVTAAFDVDRRVADHADIPRTRPSPMENLAAAERRVQVKLPYGQASEPPDRGRRHRMK